MRSCYLTHKKLHFKCLCNNTTVNRFKTIVYSEYYVKYPPVSKMYVFFSQILQYKCTCTYNFGHFHSTSRTKQCFL